MASLYSLDDRRDLQEDIDRAYQRLWDTIDNPLRVENSWARKRYAEHVEKQYRDIERLKSLLGDASGVVVATVADNSTKEAA